MEVVYFASYQNNAMVFSSSFRILGARLESSKIAALLRTVWAIAMFEAE